jgi:DNA-binding MarR family transcriptional regulator
MDDAIAAAGFADRRFPDGRVLRMCARAGGVTIAQIGRELGITRQGAAKVVATLGERGYVSVSDSPTNGREKTVTATPRAIDYLAAQGSAVRSIERRLRRELGPEGFDALHQLLAALSPDDDLSLRDYLRARTHDL